MRYLLWFLLTAAGALAQLHSASTADITPSYPVGATIAEYSTPAGGLGGMTVGPDQALWFTEWRLGKIGRLTTAGSFTYFPLPTVNGIPPLDIDPVDICTGPDGALWIAFGSAGLIGRLTTAGAFTSFPLPTSNPEVAHIVAGPDGNLWFTEMGAGQIGRITTAGVVTEFPLPTAGSLPTGITAGPDGALWFTEQHGNRIGRIDSSGNVSEYPVPTSSSGPLGIAVGPDGALWFTEAVANKIGRITTTGLISEFSIPTANSQPVSIVTGPDGGLWFTELLGNQVARMIPSGPVSEFAIPTAFSDPTTILQGPDGALWFVESQADKIGRVAIIATLPPLLNVIKSHTGNFFAGQQNAAYTVTVRNLAVPAGPATGPTVGTVTVTDSPPAGLTLVSMAGPGWTCLANSCNRDDQLSPGSSYPPITVIVDVATGASSPQVNMVTVSGGGAANTGAIDSTVIVLPPPALSISLTHTGDFAQGQQNAAYTIAVTSAGSPTSGIITVTDSLPSGLTLVSMSGAGWTCAAASCARGDSLVAYPPIAVVVNVAANAPSPLVNTATVSGGGAASASAGDSTVIGTFGVTAGIVEYPVQSEAAGLVAGPDGAIWFTDYGNSAIGRMTLAGTVTKFPIPTSNSEPVNIINGPDGALWFTESLGNKIGRITTAGAITEFPVAIPSGQPMGIALGPDGNFWITEEAGGVIVRLTPAGVVTRFPSTSAFADPDGIALGSDGALWFAEYYDSKIGRMTTSGAYTEFPLRSVGPTAIASGPDGALWFAEVGADTIGRMTTAGVLTEFAIPTAGSAPASIVNGPDGALWFNEGFASQVGRITTSGAISEFAAPNGSGAMAVGPDNAIWFSEVAASAIARLSMVAAASLSVSVSHSGNFTQSAQGTYVITVSNDAAAARTTGTVTAQESLPTGMYATAMSGPGWTCSLPNAICTRTDTLLPGASYPPIAVTVQVAANSASPVVNQASVIGGASAKATASDSTIVNPAPTLTITKSHAGDFTPGMQGAIYQVVVHNAGSAASSGTVTVTEMPPPALTVVSMAGAGWTCSGLTCTRGDPLAGGASFPVIVATVNVAANSGSPEVNAVRVAGGGSASSTATDSTVVSVQTYGAITEYPLPSGSRGGYGLAVGPDNALWFTEYGANAKIGRMTTSGAVTEFPIATQYLGEIAAGPDGALWFPDSNNNAISRMTTAGAIVSFTLPTVNAGPNGITAGPDGALWFCETGARQIGRITVLGGISEFPLPLTPSQGQPGLITTGPDGALWFTEGTSSRIGRITTAGAITEYPLATGGRYPEGITKGPDGALWFAEGQGYIGRITTGGAITEFSLPTPNSNPERIVTGADGALWFSEQTAGQIGRLTTAGAVTEYPLPTQSAQPIGIVSGPDGAIWFNEWGGQSIGRLPVTAGGAALSILGSHIGNFVPGGQGVYTVFVTNAAGALPTAGVVMVSDILPAGMTVASITGLGWACVPAKPAMCTRNDTLMPGAVYPPITVFVNVATTAGSPIANIVSVSGGGSLTASSSDATIVTYTPTPLVYYPLTPCRVADTRFGNGGILASGGTRVFSMTGGPCGLPSAAQAFSLNVTVVPAQPLSYLTVWPAGQTQPYVSTVNSPAGGVVANAAIVPAGAGGVAVYASDSTHVILDVNGYFAPAGTPAGASSLVFYPVTPCRTLDTRGGPGLKANSTQTYTIASTCGIPATAQAFSLNVTAVPSQPLGYLSIWPAGQPQPVVSTLNSPAAQIVANAAIVPAGAGASAGAISVYASDATQLVIDVNGYFAPPGGSPGYSFYAVPPCRLADTRNPTGPFGAPPLTAGATRTYAAPSGTCNLPASAQAYALNVTVLPSGPLGYVTAWPAGQTQPLVSTLNDLQGTVVANAAIVPAGIGPNGPGAFSVYVSDATQLVLDVNGYFGQ